MSSNKIVLYLLGQKGLAVLKALIGQFGSAPIAAVVGARDSGVLADRFEDILNCCREHKVLHLEKSERTEVPSAQYSLAVGWRWMIQDGSSLIVLHDGLLPRYRGFAPLVNALIRGERHLGVTAFYASKEYDAGPIIAQQSVEASYPLRVQDAIELILPCYQNLATGIVEQLLNDTRPKATPQDESQVTYSPWRDEEDYQIDWNLDSAEILRFIHALGFPYRGASANIGDRAVRILDARLADDVVIEIRAPGKVMFLADGCPVVTCRTGMLIITEARWDDTAQSLIPLANVKTRFC